MIISLLIETLNTNFNTSFGKAMASNISNTTNKKNCNMCFILVYNKLNGDTYLRKLRIEANKNENPSH